MNLLTPIKNLNKPQKGWLILLLVVFGLALCPLGYNFIRIGIVGGGALLVLGGLFIFWKSLYVRFLLLAVCLLALLVIFLPGGKPDAGVLRSKYVSALLKYENTLYIWGGENRAGIDCSGLVREGYVDANRSLGISTLNPQLLRRAFFVWWNDCSASALGNEYLGMTKLVLKADAMEKLDYTLLKPGDIAVIGTGYHTFAYLGGERWIEASPLSGNVHKISGADRAQISAGALVRIMRWSEMW